MPWHIPEDLAHFKRLTVGHPVIMGRKTYESIGRPLPGRTNIVLSRSMEKDTDGIVLVRSLEAALSKAALSKGAEEIFVIGGEAVFEATLPIANRLYLTRIATEFSGDTFFPPYKHLFHRTISSEAQSSGGHTIMFETLER